MIKRKRAVLALSLLLFCVVAFVGSSAVAKDKGTAGPVGFEPGWAWKKVGSSLQTAWLQAMKSGDKDRVFQAFVRVRDPYDPGDRSFLESKGYNVRIAEGDIVRGSFKASDLPDIAQLQFVSSINMATK